MKATFTLLFRILRNNKAQGSGGTKGAMAALLLSYLFEGYHYSYPNKTFASYAAGYIIT